MHSGCSDQAPDMPELGQVHGTITLDGKPLEGVSVLFEPENGRPSTAITDAAGKYPVSNWGPVRCGLSGALMPPVPKFPINMVPKVN